MKTGVESSEKVGDLMRVIISYHHSGAVVKCTFASCRTPGVWERKESLRKGEQGSSCTWCLPTPWMFAREEDGQEAKTILHH